jgi:hypothetical protein
VQNAAPSNVAAVAGAVVGVLLSLALVALLVFIFVVRPRMRAKYGGASTDGVRPSGSATEVVFGSLAASTVLIPPAARSS